MTGDLMSTCWGEFMSVRRAKFSVVTATYNCAAELPGLAESLQKQQCRDYEWIVIDGGSQDGTTRVLERLGSQVTYWSSEPDQGIYDAWNKGLEQVRGEYVLFLGADDRIGAHWLEAASAVEGEPDLIYGDVCITGGGARPFRRTVVSLPWNELRPQLSRQMCIPHPGLIHHRRLFAKRRFDISYRFRADYHFLLTASVSNAAYTPWVVQAFVAWGGASNKASSVSACFRETRRLFRTIGISMPVSDRLRWYLKVALALCPPLFELVQSWRWRLRFPRTEAGRGSTHAQASEPQ